MAKFGPGGPESLDSMDDESMPGMIAISEYGQCALLKHKHLMAWADGRIFPTIGFICSKCDQGFVLDTDRAAEIAAEMPDSLTYETPCPLAEYMVE